jgi:ribosomal protein L19E
MMTSSGMRSSSAEIAADKVSPVRFSRVTRRKRLRAEQVGRQGGDGKARHGVAGWRADEDGPWQGAQRVEVIHLRVEELGILFA